MAPKMAPNRRQRRSERQSASHMATATAMRWFAEMPEGPCRAAVADLMEELLACGVSDETALE